MAVAHDVDHFRRAEAGEVVGFELRKITDVAKRLEKHRIARLAVLPQPFPDFATDSRLNERLLGAHLPGDAEEQGQLTEYHDDARGATDRSRKFPPCSHELLIKVIDGE